MAKQAHDKLNALTSQDESLIGVRLADSALVRRAQHGDKPAFDVLVAKYQTRLEKVVARYVADSHEVYDVTQEAFIKAYRGLDKFRGNSSFYTWLYRIAVNTAKNHIISTARRSADTNIDEHPHISSEASPERMLLRDEIERTVFTVINTLPIELRIAIILRELEGLSYEQIADIMNCPLGTVRSRLFRAREAIDHNVQPLLRD